MGWFSSLFRKKKEPEIRKKHIHVNELRQWFDSESETAIESIKNSIKEDLDSIKENKEKIKEASKTLEEAKLKNDKIPERAMHIMEGNRKSYIQAVNNFMESLEMPSVINFSTVSDFVSDFEDKLSNFTKTSARNFQVLQEFFAKESGEIARNIKDMDLTVRNLLDNDYKKINNISANIEKVNELLNKIGSAKQMLSDYEKQRYQLTQEIQKVKDSLEELKGSDDYKRVKEAEKKKSDTEKRMKEAERRLSELFAPLERPLRKYSRIIPEGEDTLNAYLESPMKALQDDREMKILSILDRMRSSIEKGELEIKDKAKEKALKQISMITEDTLRKLLSEYDSLKEAIDGMDKSIKYNMALQRKDEMEYKLSHLNEKLSKLDENIEKLNKYMHMPEMEEALKEIREEAKDALNTDLRIKIDSKVIGGEEKQGKAEE
ncbi:MAG: hypothetical protein R6U32_07295 [Candidatus Woesearchaeota archaeon]